MLMRLMNSATKMKFAGNQKNMPSGYLDTWFSRKNDWATTHE
jgi:hypothetical protein